VSVLPVCLVAWVCEEGVEGLRRCKHIILLPATVSRRPNASTGSQRVRIDASTGSLREEGEAKHQAGSGAVVDDLLMDGRWLQGDGDYEVVPGFEMNEWLSNKIKATEEELIKERNCVGHLIPNATEAFCEISEDTMLPGEA
jgi:hypothetical protein